MLSLNDFLGWRRKRRATRVVVEGVEKPKRAKPKASTIEKHEAWKKANADKVRGYYAKYLKSEKGQATQKRARKRRYWADPEKAKQIARDFYRENAEAIKARNRARYAEQREAILAQRKERRASGR